MTFDGALPSWIAGVAWGGALIAGVAWGWRQALPLSIFFGLAIFAATKTAMMPFLEPLLDNQILV